MCEIEFAHIFLCETGGEGGGRRFLSCLKNEKSAQMFPDFFIKKHLRTFRKIETRGGGAAILKLSPRNRI